MSRRLSIPAWSAAGLLAAMAFALYGSIVPLHLVRRPDVWGAIHDRFLLSLREPISRVDAASNILLFVPIGFFGAASFISARRRAVGIVTIAVLFLVGAALFSVAIEAVQVMIPGRTTSLIDVAAQAVGTIGGTLAWLFVARDVRAWASTDDTFERNRRALTVLLAAYVAVRVFSMLLPLDIAVDPASLLHKYPDGGIVLLPWHSRAFTRDLVTDRVADFVLSIPFGLFSAFAGMPEGRRRRTVFAVMMAALIAISAEIAQVFVASRTADAGECLVNGMGGLMGVWLASTFGAPTAARSPGASSSARIAAAGVAASAAIYAAYNWIPFNFQVSADLARARASFLFDVPFAAYYANPAFHSLEEALLKLSLGAPLGAFLRLWLQSCPARYRRPVWLAVFIAAGAFFTVVECGQVFLPTRYPDNSDILLGLGGLVVGAMIGRLAERRVSAPNSQTMP